MVVGEFTQEAPLVVIGGGPGGYSAAFRAAELGVQAVMIDPAETLGGVCLHHGCIPSKTLLHVTETIRLARTAEQFGVTFGEPTVDLDRVRNWVEHAITTLGKGLSSLCKHHQIEHLRARASFEDSKHLHLTGGSVPRVKFRRAVIATGSTPVQHPVLPFDHSCIWTPGRALALPSVPPRLLIIGHDYLAIELASIYATLGSRVTLIDAGEAMLPQADPDLARPLVRTLKQQLDTVALKTSIVSADLDAEQITVTFDTAAPMERETYDRVIVGIGQRANIDDLGLDHTEVQTDEGGFIHVNERMTTDNPRIFAVGDVVGAPLSADKALHQGRVCAEVIAGWDSAFDAMTVPSVVFTDPQLAWCGLTEREAAEDGRPFKVRKVPWGASGRAVSMGRAEGVTKLIYDPDTQLVLGVGIAGPHAAEMIGEAVVAIEMGAVLTDLAGSIHPHPTMSELLRDAAFQSLPNDKGGA